MDSYKYFDDKQLYTLIFQNDFSKIQEFLNKYGINSRDRDDATFLMSCVVENEKEYVIKLIEIGTDINAQRQGGFTALHLAVQEKHLEIIDTLLNNENIEVDIQDDYGHTPLLRILTNGNRKDPVNYIMAKKLIKNGASINIKNSSNESPKSIMQKISNEKIIDTDNNLVDYSSLY